MLTKYHTLEMVAVSERKLRNALKFGTTGEVNSKKRLNFSERHSPSCHIIPPNGSEGGALQVDLDGAVGEGHI